jgi:hypothetical protein
MDRSAPQQFTLCQRWDRQRDRYRPAGETIRPHLYGVEVIDDRAAIEFIATHHYARTSPPQMLSVGLFESGGFERARLVGVCRFSVPMNQAAVPARTGQPPEAGCELGRLVLVDSVPGNGESFFVARAFRLLRTERPRMRTVVSYSDPVPRFRADGSMVKPGHLGCVYQALNARYLGRSSARTLLVAPDGTVVSERSLSKLRNDERGADYAYRQLRALGAPPLAPTESGRKYVARVTALPLFRRMRHPGNLTYAWGLGGRHERARVEAGMPAALPYPRLRDSPRGDADDDPATPGAPRDIARCAGA